MFDQVIQLSQEQGLTLAEIGKRYGQSRLVLQLVGAPTQIADQLETIFAEEGADGFVISPAYIPGAFDDFVELVIPELQRRRLFREEYTGSTLREHLGLKIPS